MAAAYLEQPKQRRAAEHGIPDNANTLGGPLLVIAGAGSGKSNTLVHRVAHLIVDGAGRRGDRHVDASRTRFIPAAVMRHFECVTWPVARAETGGRKDAGQVRVDVSSKMRGMWR